MSVRALLAQSDRRRAAAHVEQISEKVCFRKLSLKTECELSHPKRDWRPASFVKRPSLRRHRLSQKASAAGTAAEDALRCGKARQTHPLSTSLKAIRSAIERSCGPHTGAWPIGA